ncbi:MAG: TRAP transporter large permease subunit, partial [Myxococcota bacterium]
MSADATAPFGRIRRGFRHGERWLTVVIIVAMAILPTLEAVSRRLGVAGIPGSLLFTQHLTLWIGFLGALLASGSGKHLALASGALLPETWRGPARIYVGALSAGVTAILTYASALLVQADATMPRTLPGGIPEWTSELVMPVALALMAVRFVWHAADTLRDRALAFALTIVFATVGLWAGEASLLLVPATLAIFAALLLGAPVFVAMAGMAMLLFFHDGTPIASVPAETYRLVASATLPAIPLLTAAGYVLAQGGASTRLLRLARALVGWLPGGMALMVTLVCAAFTTFTGGSGVTILALGGLMLPLLVGEGYPRGFSIGLITSAGSLGLLFPP